MNIYREREHGERGTFSIYQYLKITSTPRETLISYGSQQAAFSKLFK